MTNTSIILSHNENPYGPSLEVLEALKSPTAINRYPEKQAQSLKEDLSALYNLNQTQLICGHGSEEIIYKSISVLSGPGEEVVIHAHSFHAYKHATLLARSTPVIIQQPNLDYNCDAILEAITPHTKIIVIDNPGNPLGCYLSKEKIETLLSQIPSSITLILDAAYADFVTECDYSSGLELVDRYPNLLIIRTFSKLYGLAGIRLGWAYSGIEISKTINKSLSPYNVSTLAIIAGKAALKDQEWLKDCCDRMIEQRSQLQKFLIKTQTPYLQSHGNFILCKPADLTLLEHLQKDDIHVRQGSIWGLANHIRISVGTAFEMQKLYQSWQTWMQLIAT